MSLKTSDYTFDSQIVRTIFAVALLVLTAGIMLWYENIHKNPSNVFWGMVRNNLSTYGVTRSITQDADAGVGFERSSKIAYIPEFSIEATTKLTQANQQQTTIVKTRSITKNGKTISSYRGIEGDRINKDKVTPLLNNWFEDNLSKDQIAEVVGLVPGYVAGSPPFVSLGHQSVLSELDAIKKDGTYRVDYSGAKKVSVDGKNALEFDVKVDVVGYLKMLSRISKSTGIDYTPINVENFNNNPPIELLMTVSINGKQLLKVTDKQTEREEKFSGYGAVSLIDLPKIDTSKANIEKLLQKLVNSPAS